MLLLGLRLWFVCGFGLFLFVVCGGGCVVFFGFCCGVVVVGFLFVLWCFVVVGFVFSSELPLACRGKKLLP